MKLDKVPFQDGSFLEIRDFLVREYKEGNIQNWAIDRWNFCRFIPQIFLGSFESWPGTVGIWTNNGEIAAVVTAEGELRGEAYFQLGRQNFSDKNYLEFIEHAEKHLSLKKDGKRALYLGMGEKHRQLQNILQDQGYELYADFPHEETIVMPLDKEFPVKIPKGYRIDIASRQDSYAIAVAHAKAFNFYKTRGGDLTTEARAFELLRNAPDYLEELDLVIIAPGGEMASFITIWWDQVNNVGHLEPVGTIPEHQKKGLGRALIYHGCNLLREMGGETITVGPDQPFYQRIGFKLQYKNNIWTKTWNA